MHLKKPEYTNIIPNMDLETSNITSIMDTALADVIPLSLEALDEPSVSEEFETLVEENHSLTWTIMMMLKKNILSRSV